MRCRWDRGRRKGTKTGDSFLLKKDRRKLFKKGDGGCMDRTLRTEP